MRAPFRARAQAERTGIRLPASSSIRSAPARACSARSTMVFRASDRGAASPRTATAFRRISRLPDAPPGWSKSGSRRSRTSGREIEGWDAPFDTVSETSPRVKLAQRIARTVRRLVDARAGRHRARAAAMATCWSWCASAANCSRRSSARSRTKTSRSPAPTGWCSPSISRSWTSWRSPMRCCCRRTISRWRPCCAARCSVSTTKICSRIAWDRGRSSLRAALAQQGRRSAKYSPRPQRASMNWRERRGARRRLRSMRDIARRRRRAAALPRPARRRGQ